MYFDAVLVIPYAVGCNWWMMAMMRLDDICIAASIEVVHT